MSWTDFFTVQFQFLLCYIAYLLLSNKTKHLNINRFYLIGAPLLLLGFSQIDVFYTNETKELFQFELPTLIAESTSTATYSVGFDWLWFLYIFGVVISTLWFLYQLIRVIYQPVIKPLSRHGKVNVYLIENKTDSYSFLNRVYLSESQLHEAEFVLKHELAHCQQKHSYDILLISLIQIVFWFNPVVYLWKRKIKENHEYLADRASISSEEDIKAYSLALLSAHMGVSLPDLGNGFNQPSLLRKRIIQLKTKNKIAMKHFILIPAIVGTTLLTSSLTIADYQQLPMKKEINGTIDQEPEFPGGMDALMTYIQENINYPEELKKSKTEGMVVISFIVTNTGAIKDVSVKQTSTHDAFDQEAMRLVKGMPNWKPGVKDGKEVPVEMKLPFAFKL